MAATTPVSQPGPLETAIREKVGVLEAAPAVRSCVCTVPQLTLEFNPTVLKISNDSWQHRHHAAMRAQGSDGTGETHFSVQIVSAAFQSKTTMQRHRLIYATLKAELDGGLHALSLQTRTEEEELQRSTS
ncbi:Bola-like protein [Mycena sanguinolenta]|uniref:Bola-like protein n=1 Tax=Mycena sanguinolenta TaxID=230812 RepID=A0A8H7DK40_9AGAR|nr:Bola-like protein [Mycena sanguinolenta]